MPICESRMFEKQTWIFLFGRGGNGTTWLELYYTQKEHSDTTVQLYNEITSFTRIMFWPDRQVNMAHESTVLKLRSNINHRVKSSKLQYFWNVQEVDFYFDALEYVLQVKQPLFQSENILVMADCLHKKMKLLFNQHKNCVWTLVDVWQQRLTFQRRHKTGYGPYTLLTQNTICSNFCIYLFIYLQTQSADVPLTQSRWITLRNLPQTSWRWPQGTFIILISSSSSSSSLLQKNFKKPVGS